MICLGFSPIVEICSRVKVKGYNDLATVSPNASGSLHNANGKKQTLSRKTKAVHDHLHLPFHKNRSNQNEVEVEDLRIMSDRDYLFCPRSRFA